MAIFARWGRFSSERDFYRYARTCLCNAFPTLPDRSQFNRLVRSHAELMEASKRLRAPAPVPKAWAERPPRIRRPRTASPPGADLKAASVLHRPTTLGEPARPAFEGPQAGAVLQEASTLEELADGFVDHRDGDRTFVGIDPDEHLHARVPPFRSDLRHRRARRTFRLRAVHTPLLSHFARRSLRRGASREQANPSHGRQEVRERSLKPVP